jgi:hypothetical protein
LSFGGGRKWLGKDKIGGKKYLREQKKKSNNNANF